MKKSILAASMLAVLSVGALQTAAAEFSGNVALSTDYVWRGVSQTDNGAAISGGFDYGHESGFYLGTWASNVEFGDDANIELDVYGGFGGEFGGGVSYDVGIIHYGYPSESGLDFEEVYVGLGYGPVSAKISHDFDNENTYYEAGVGHEVGGVSLAAHIGHYDFDGGGEYTDWKLGISKDVMGVTLDLSYTDTDIDNSDIADGRAVFTVSKSL